MENHTSTLTKEAVEQVTGQDLYYNVASTANDNQARRISRQRNAHIRNRDPINLSETLDASMNSTEQDTR